MANGHSADNGVGNAMVDGHKFTRTCLDAMRHDDRKLFSPAILAIIAAIVVEVVKTCIDEDESPGQQSMRLRRIGREIRAGSWAAWWRYSRPFKRIVRKHLGNAEHVDIVAEAIILSAVTLQSPDARAIVAEIRGEK